MSDKLAQVFLAWTVNYLLHSTLIVVLAMCVVRFWKRAGTATRDLIWKSALVLPIGTATLPMCMVETPVVDVRLTAAAPDAQAAHHADQRVSSDSPGPFGDSPSRFETLSVGSVQREDTPAGSHPASSAGPVAAESNGSGDGRHSSGGIEILFQDSTSQPLSESTIVMTAKTPEDRQRNTARPTSSLTPAVPSHSVMQAPDPGPYWTWPRFVRVLACGWGLLCGVGLLRTAVAQYRLRIRYQPLRQADPHWNRLLEQVCRELGIRRSIALRVSDACAEPLVMYAFRPVIVVPTALEKLLSEGEMRAIVLHELVHVMRRDLVWSQGLSLWLRIFPFQPLNRYAVRAWRANVEQLCDEWVVWHGVSQTDLAHSLTRITEWRVTGRLEPVASTLTFAGPASSLGTRIRRLVGFRGRRCPRATRMHSAVLIAAMAGLVTASLLAGPVVAFTRSKPIGRSVDIVPEPSSIRTGVSDQATSNIEQLGTSGLDDGEQFTEDNSDVWSAIDSEIRFLRSELTRLEQLAADRNLERGRLQSVIDRLEQQLQISERRLQALRETSSSAESTIQFKEEFE